MPLLLPANALIALAAAASWGGGDFSGAMGVKSAGGSTTSALRVVVVAHASSLAVLLVLLVCTHAALPHGAPMAWALASGIAGAFSLTAFYIALSRGAMGASAAISGLLAAAIPVVVSSAIEGRPSILRLAGFVLAGCAIWAIAAGPSPENISDTPALGNIPDAPARISSLLDNTMLLAIIGGLGFGFYFVALRMATPLGVFEPMALARAASTTTCLLLLAILSRISAPSSLAAAATPTAAATLSSRPEHRASAMRSEETRVFLDGPTPCQLPQTAICWALGVALLDTGGNLLFLAATRLGRLDVAAVLASLYPASTILLAAWRLHERPTRRQFTGMLVALAAVVMITL